MAFSKRSSEARESIDCRRTVDCESAAASSISSRRRWPSGAVGLLSSSRMIKSPAKRSTRKRSLEFREPAPQLPVHGSKATDADALLCQLCQHRRQSEFGKPKASVPSTGLIRPARTQARARWHVTFDIAASSFNEYLQEDSAVALLSFGSVLTDSIRALHWGPRLRPVY